jgi:hypothetical protein
VRVCCEARKERRAGKDGCLLRGELGDGGRRHDHAAVPFEVGECVVETECCLALQECGVGGDTIGVLVAGAGASRLFQAITRVVPLIGVAVQLTSYTSRCRISRTPSLRFTA